MNRKKILVIEDDHDTVEMIRLSFQRYWPEAEVITAYLGSEGLEMIVQETIDTVILDLGLPDINGFELCKQIRQKSNVPIIFLTARSEEVDRVVGLEIGGDDYVVKPFSPRELTARVKAILRRSRQKDKTPQASNNAWQIDSAKRQITYFGQLLDLSRTEYDLMQTFIQRPGQVFTRDHLMAAVWDEPEASMDRTVDAHIKNLRAKLKAVRPDIDPIVTHRGTGYALKEDL